MKIVRGQTFTVLKKESYWYQEQGTVVAIDESLDLNSSNLPINESKIIYGVTLRFEKVNYNGVNTANFHQSEFKQLK